VTSLANLRGRFSCQVQNHLLEPVRELDLRADGELRLDVGSPHPLSSGCGATNGSLRDASFSTST